MSDWRRRAACLGGDPELHFPVGLTGPAVAQAEAAKAVCRTCPVIDSCREYALSRQNPPTTTGIWAMLWFDAGEARAYRRRQVVAS